MLVAQDLASWGLDRSGPGAGARVPPALPAPSWGWSAVWPRRWRVSGSCTSTRRRSTTPSSTPIIGSGVAYFDLSLQHVSRPLVERMRRWGDGDRFLERIATIRDAAPDVALRSSFILGYPGETEDDHDRLLDFLTTPASTGRGSSPSPPSRAPTPPTWTGWCRPSWPRSACANAPSSRTPSPPSAGRRWWASASRCWWTSPGSPARYRESPEIDGVVHVPTTLAPGSSTRCSSPRPQARTCGGDVSSPATPPSTNRPAPTAGGARQGAARERVREIHLRAVGHHHAGQRHHRGPPPGHARAGGHDRRERSRVGALRGGAGHRPHRRGRRLAGAAPGHHPVGRLPRPVGGQGGRRRRACAPWRPRRRCRGCRWRSSRRARCG